jgi:uncharacterized protein affecting Mg2+/Co2+ transport
LKRDNSGALQSAGSLVLTSWTNSSEDEVKREFNRFGFGKCAQRKKDEVKVRNRGNYFVMLVAAVWLFSDGAAQSTILHGQTTFGGTGNEAKAQNGSLRFSEER